MGPEAWGGPVRRWNDLTERNERRFQRASAEALFLLAVLEWSPGGRYSGAGWKATVRATGTEGTPMRRRPGEGRSRVVWGWLLGGVLLVAACSPGPAEKAAEHRRRAESYRGQGKLREAAVEYQAALQETPGDPDLLYGLARVLRAQGRLEEYRGYLKRALEADPGHRGAALELAAFYLGASAYGPAAELAGRVLATAGSDGEALLVRARALSGLGRLEEAQEAWEALLGLDEVPAEAFAPAADFFLRNGDEARALSVLERGIRSHPEATGLAVAKAGLLARLGRLEDAEEVLRSARERRPGDPELIGAWAKLLVRKGKGEEAGAFLRQSLDAAGDDPALAVPLALEAADVLVAVGRAAEASELLERVRRLAPEDPALAAGLADVWITLGRTREARELLPVAAKVDPAGRTAALLEARLYLEEGMAPRAKFVLEPLLARGDLGVDAHYLYGKALAAMRRWVDARRELLLVLDRVPDHVLARIDYASLLARMGDAQGALRQLDRLPRWARGDARAELLRARVLIALGRWKEARGALDRLRARAPDNPVLLALEGDLAAARGRMKTALRFYRKSQEKSPSAFEPVLAEARVLLRTGAPLRRIEDLLEEYQQRARETPFVLNFLATLHLDRGNLEEAGRYLERSLLVEPNFWETRYLRARLALRRGERTKAIGDLQEAIRLAPSEPTAYNELAALYRKEGEVDKAEELYRRLLDENPREPFTSNNLAVLLLEKGEVREAVQLARIALEGAPTNPHIKDTLGWALHLDGNTAQGLPWLKEAVAELGDDPEVLYHYAQALHEAGRVEEAKTVARSVIRLAPESRYAEALSGWL